MPGLTTSERVLEQVSGRAGPRQPRLRPAARLDRERGVLGATVAVEDPRCGESVHAAVQAFYDAPGTASFRVDVPGWRLLVEAEPLFTQGD